MPARLIQIQEVDMWSSRLLDAPAQRLIVTHYQTGLWTQKMLAKEFDCSAMLIRNVLKAHGVKKPPKPVPPEVLVERAERKKKRERQRYAEDPAYRERIKANARKEDPEKRRARLNKYWEDPKYRARAKAREQARAEKRKQAKDSG